MTLAEHFINELNDNESKYNLELELFHDTILKYKGKRFDRGFEFEDGSRVYYDLYKGFVI